MRLRTKLVGPHTVQHSYYVSLLHWIADKFYNRAEQVVERAFEA